MADGEQRRAERLDEVRYSSAFDFWRCLAPGLLLEWDNGLLTMKNVPVEN